ncbi:MAG: aspartyl protease family protein [Ignavibacteriota bacterium]
MRGLLISVGLIAFTALSDGASAPHLPAVSASYRIKLDRWVVAPNRTAGLLVRVRVNGGPPLRLLVDSGTQYVVLTQSAAARSGCHGGDDIELVGAGAPSPAIAKSLRAATLELGDLTLRDTPLLITDHPLADGIQGALPLSIFAGFLIRLDIRAQELDLIPYPEPLDREGSLPVLSSNRLLFLKGTVNESHEGYFLLDTGAAYNAISQNLARQLHVSDVLSSHVPLQGGIAAFEAPLLSGAVRLRLAGRQSASGRWWRSTSLPQAVIIISKFPASLATPHCAIPSSP